MRYNAILLFAIGSVLICSATVFGQESKLHGTSWKLTEANGARVLSSATLVFSATANEFSGSTGCNVMAGAVTVRGRNIDFGPARTTKRFCKLPEGSLPETEFLSALEKARRFSLSSKRLSLFDKRGRAVLRFAKTDAASNGSNDTGNLESKKWVLESIKGRQTLVALPYAFLNFDANKGSAGGDTSCNVFGGDYTATGSRIHFSNIISTMRACIEDEAKMSTERDMLEGLRQADRFELRDERLVLYRDRELLLTFRGDKR